MNAHTVNTEFRRVKLSAGGNGQHARAADEHALAARDLQRPAGENRQRAVVYRHHIGRRVPGYRTVDLDDARHARGRDNMVFPAERRHAAAPVRAGPVARPAKPLQHDRLGEQRRKPHALETVHVVGQQAGVAQPLGCDLDVIACQHRNHGAGPVADGLHLVVTRESAGLTVLEEVGIVDLPPLPVLDSLVPVIVIVEVVEEQVVIVLGNSDPGIVDCYVVGEAVGFFMCDVVPYDRIHAAVRIEILRAAGVIQADVLGAVVGVGKLDNGKPGLSSYDIRCLSNFLGHFDAQDLAGRRLNDRPDRCGAVAGTVGAS